MKQIINRITLFWRRYQKNHLAVIGLIILIFFVFIALFAPYITEYDPMKISSESHVSPNKKHLLGTDYLGKDIFSGILFGARISLFVGFLSAIMSATIGVVIGSIAGYYGGKIDGILMRITEMNLIIPRFMLILVIISMYGSSILIIAVTIGVFSWSGTARLVRAEFLSLKERQFVESARALGSGDLMIIFSEIMPNAISTVIINTSLLVAAAIKTEAGLSYLGLGDPTSTSWGMMLNKAQHFLRHAWWPAVFPGFCIFLLTLSLNLVGDGLNDALNPRLKER